MADTTHTIGSTGIVKKLVDLGDGTYADASYTRPTALEDEQVLAAASGSTGGFGKIGNLAATSGVMYPCIDASDAAYTKVDWRVKGAAAHNVQLYKARSRVDSVTLTCSSLGDTETLVINGLTYTAESTANTADAASREFSVAGTDTQDAAALAALINADYAIVTAGTSVAGTDKLTFVTNDGTYVITAAAAADYDASKYALSGTAATEAASIVLAINHKDNVKFEEDATAFTATNPATAEAEDYALSIELIADHNTHTGSTVYHYAATAAVSTTAATSEATLVAQVNASRTAMLAHYADTTAHGVADATNLATVAATSACTDAATARTLVNALAAAHLAHIATAKRAANDTITINGLVFTAKTGAEDAATRKFSIDTSADATGTSLAALVNDATYGVPGVTATNVSGVVSFARDTVDDTVTVSVANAATHPHKVMTVETAGGVPGVIAAVSGLASGAEIVITPVWVSSLSLTETGDRLTVTDIDCPGVYATSSDAVVTLVPGMPGTPDGQEVASVIYAVTGTAGAHLAVANNTLASLIKHGAAVTGVADNSATAGTFYEQWLDGWPYAYCGVTNTGSAAAFTVGATLYS